MRAKLINVLKSGFCFFRCDQQKAKLGLFERLGIDFGFKHKKKTSSAGFIMIYH